MKTRNIFRVPFLSRTEFQPPFLVLWCRWGRDTGSCLSNRFTKKRLYPPNRFRKKKILYLFLYGFIYVWSTKYPPEIVSFYTSILLLLVFYYFTVILFTCQWLFWKHRVAEKLFSVGTIENSVKEEHSSNGREDTKFI